MTPIQQMFLGVGGATKTYLDDVFSTYLWAGDADNNRVITTNIDQSGEGCLSWIKCLDGGEDHVFVDTERGVSKIISSNSTGSETGNVDVVPAFTSSGFNPGSHSAVNGSGNTYAGWTFRKSPGFFDVVTYTGTGAGAGSPQTINHSLESIPGMIIIKNLDQSSQWFVYNVEIGEDQFLQLNKTDATVGYNGGFKNITSSSVGVFDSNSTNGDEYVAYFFAGGASTAATASSVDFSGSNEWLIAGSSSDYSMGTGDFTVEGWVRKDGSGGGSNPGIFQISSSSTGVNSANYQNTIALGHDGAQWAMYGGGSDTGSDSDPITLGQWYHFAYCRSSGVSKTFINGEEKISKSDTVDYAGTYISIGAYYNSTFVWEGLISNFRVIKGTALYTSSFRPPTEPLTNVTNTKLLCCNDSTSETGSTVVSGSITTQGSPTARTYSPFNDTAGFKFGASGDQEIIKHDIIKTDGSGRATVHLGWEPQWLMWKKTSGTGSWGMYDAMRGVYSDASDNYLIANGGNTQAATGVDILNWTPTGFECHLSAHPNSDFLVTCIRRPDGYVGKPADVGTDVFALDVGNSSTTVPCMDSGFPVDWAFRRAPASTSEWYAQYRMMDPDVGLQLDTDGVEQSGFGSTQKFNSNLGWASHMGSNYQSWMWKRGQGFDVVFYDGDSSSTRDIPHSLNAVPEMFWIKRRTGGSGDKWAVYHKDIGNTKYLRVNTNQYAYTDTIWNNTTPTSTHFTLGTDSAVNTGSGGTYVAMLFSSVPGISKCGSYTGTDSNPGPTITTGFQPRFIMIKCHNQNGTNWVVLDSLRTFDNYSWLNLQNAQSNSLDILDVSSTGFTIKAAYTDTNVYEYIYYAHA